MIDYFQIFAFKKDARALITPNISASRAQTLKNRYTRNLFWDLSIRALPLQKTPQKNKIRTLMQSTMQT